MTKDIYELGRAMREALDGLLGCVPQWEKNADEIKKAHSVIAAFDKALSEPPAAPADVAGLVDRLEEWAAVATREGWPRNAEAMREAATAIERLARERDDARARADVAERNLGNILARIHRDGGQYQDEHGTLKACVDADLIVSNLLAMQDSAEAAQARASNAEAMRREASLNMAIANQAREAAEARIASLEEALCGSITAIDDWLNIYAIDMCDMRRVRKARDRIAEAGGTLAYIARIQAANRAALAKTEEGK